MSADELGGRMNHHVCTVFDGTEDNWGEGVVDNHYDVVFVCNLSDGIQIGHVAVGISEGLHIDSLGVGLNGIFQCLKVVDIDDSVGDTLCAECVGDEIVGTAIEVVGCYDVVTILGDVLECVSDSCGT